MTSAGSPNIDALYRLTVDTFADDHFRVESFHGHERMSEPYAFDVVAVVATPVDEELERLALGQRAVLTWSVGASQRAFYGVVAAVRLAEVHDVEPRWVQYHLRIVPRLWLTKRRKNTRIFQGLRVPEVVDAVLSAAGIGTRWQLVHDHPVRPYVTQYEESDLHFVKRLCAEAGIYFHFAQGGALDGAPAAGTLIPGDTVIFGDDASSYPPIGGDDPAAFSAPDPSAAPLPAAAAPTLYFLGMQGTAASHADKVTHFSARTVVKATAASFRDYDPDRPQARPASTATSTQPFPSPDASPDSGASQAALPDLEAYEHHGPFLFPSWSYAGEEAARILRQKRRRASTAQGESGCPDLSPGHRFALADHPAAHLDRAWVVTSVEHHGLARPRPGADRTFHNAFHVVPAEVAFVPPRPKRRHVQVALTATVVGPPGEEIHTDATGQIKVQFHWDREGGYTDQSSCWIRTMHPWGGAGWGVQFIPRVGMEVVVVFEGGDPDKPLVMGAVYNGTHPPPFLLPGDKTRSGVRTQSSPGGGGSNELSFEDARGREQVYVHAQRDLDEVAERNHTLMVRGDERLRVLGSRMDLVEEDVIARVGHNVEEHVANDRTSQVEGNRIDVVTGNSDERVSGMLVTRVEGKERRDVQGSAHLEYADDLVTRVKGCQVTVVGTQDKKRSWVTHAEGTSELSGLDLLKLSSTKELVLGVGRSSIRITPDKIELNSAAICAKGGEGGLSASDDGLALSSKGDAQLLVGKKFVLKTAGASLSLEKEVKIDGDKILLNSPDQATDAPPKDPEPPTKIMLADQEGATLGYQRFLITLDDGSEVSGVLDEDGTADLDLPDSGKVIFPDLTMPGDAVTGEVKPYVVQQGDYLAKLAMVHGFDVDKVWNDPKNAAVKEKRKKPNLLHPGDLVYLPRAKRRGLPLAKGATNKYTANVPRTTVRIGFKNERGPIADAAYIVEGMGAPASGTTDGEGVLSLSVPLHVREVHVVFTKQNIAYPVRIGDMDPIDEPMGIRKRLQHLGYHTGDGDDAAEADKLAITAFQRAQGLPVTGAPDEATKQALSKEHGC